MNMMSIHHYDENKFPQHALLDNDELSEDEKVNKLCELLSDNDINQQEDKYKYTVLHLAVGKKLPHVVNLLVDRKADLNITDSYGLTALHLAAYIGSTSIALALMEAGADINITR